jgi:hypothetical protein
LHQNLQTNYKIVPQLSQTNAFFLSKEIFIWADQKMVFWTQEEGKVLGKIEMISKVILDSILLLLRTAATD